MQPGRHVFEGTMITETNAYRAMSTLKIQSPNVVSSIILKDYVTLEVYVLNKKNLIEPTQIDEEIVNRLSEEIREEVRETLHKHWQALERAGNR